MIRLSAGQASLLVDTDQGGRIASLVVADRELLVTSGFGPFGWGSFPMAPFAGRLRNARLAFEGRTYELPANEAPHALHGLVFERPWETLDQDAAAVTIGCELGAPWPFGGRVRQRFVLAADRLDVAMELEADEPQPAVIGWHPWFRRRVDGKEIEIDVEPSAMYRLDADGIPTGELVDPVPRPWDDCFVGLARPPLVRWPGVVRLAIDSDANAWVVYDRQIDGICIEPQTGPPDEPNFAPRITVPGDPLRIAMTWRWAPDEGAGTPDGGAGAPGAP